MGKHRPQFQNRPQLIIPQSIVHKKQLADFVEAQAAINNKAIEEFQEWAYAYFDAIRPVDRTLAQFNILTFANGGGDTAKAFGIVADNLMSAVNALQRAMTTLEQSPFMDNFGEIKELVKQCGAARILANHYATVSDYERPNLLRKMSKAVSQAQTVLNGIHRNTRHNNSELPVIAQMIKSRLDRNMAYGEALADLQKTDPELYRRYFTHSDAAQKVAYARQLVKRYCVTK